MNKKFSILLLILASLVYSPKVNSAQLFQTYNLINKENFIENKSENKILYSKLKFKEYRDRSNIRRIRKCEENSHSSNNVGVGMTSSFLLAMVPQPLPKCNPIRMPKA